MNKYEQAQRAMKRSPQYLFAVLASSKLHGNTEMCGEDALGLQNQYGLDLYSIAILAFSHGLSIDYDEYKRLKDIEDSKVAYPCSKVSND